jgi:molecular chaperone GrpE
MIDKPEIDPAVQAPQAAADTASDPVIAANDETALVEAQARAAEFHEAFLRAKAETENVRRRGQEDVAKAYKFAVENFAESLLPVIDSLEAAVASSVEASETVKSGMDLTLKQLYTALEKAKVLPINPLGEKFDPNKHQAISMVPVAEGLAANHVASVLQKGWLIADRVLRPALVTVAQA